MPRPYQPTWIRGKQLPGIPGKDYQRDCADRYEEIKRAISSLGYTRRFTVFDLGTNMGYFMLRISEDFNAFVVGADKQKRLGAILRRNKNHNVAWLQLHLSADQLFKLSQCEVFDIGLMLAVAHHYDNPIRAISGMIRLCRNLLIEIPIDDPNAKNPEGHKDVYKYVDNRAVRLAEFRSHTGGRRILYHLDNGSRTELIQPTIDADVRGVDCNVKVILSPQAAKCVIARPQKPEMRDFIPGMNLWNMRLLNVGYPALDHLTKLYLKAIEPDDHDDAMPWNYIFDGRLHRIDDGFKSGKKRGAHRGKFIWRTGKWDKKSYGRRNEVYT